MADSALVTLTTDFGEGSAYVAAMKGAILSVSPAVRILDLSHRIPPQDLVTTAYFLAETFPIFPAHTIHVVVVDPGVGTSRHLLCVRWNDQYLLVPDNGCWSRLESLAKSPVRAYRLTNDKYWRTPVSATFHGRDILAPAAGHLANGLSLGDLGTPTESWVRLPLPEPVHSAGFIRGEIVVVDSFGNLISNVSASAGDRILGVRIAGQTVAKSVRTYGDGEPGEVVALIGSGGRIEVAVVNGSAARILGLGVGAPIELDFET
jgi:S-adenosylmethionine hydrolase